jgi:hypothetical protein
MTEATTSRTSTRQRGTAYLLPANIKAEVLQSLAGEGTALARQILSAVDEMTPPQRVAAGEVIGQALAESDHLPDLKTQVIGELWLRDLELTAWHVLHAERRSDDPAGRPGALARLTRAAGAVTSVMLSRPPTSGRGRPRPRSAPWGKVHRSDRCQVGSRVATLASVPIPGRRRRAGRCHRLWLQGPT